MVTALIPSFNAGELSPLIHLRSDLEKYRSGCRTLRNMLISPYGGARRRNGFEYVATSPGAGRLFPFQAGSSLGYVLEFTAGLLRFYRNGVLIQAGGATYSLASPYSAADLADLRVAQLNDVAYLVHPSYPVHRLARFSEASWELVELEFDYPAMREENLQKWKKLTVGRAGEEGVAVKLTASWNAFNAGNVGGYFQISQERAIDQFDIELEATSANDGLTSDPLIVQGAWNLTTRGTWSGTFTVQRSTDGGDTWQNIRKFTSDADTNFTAGGTEKARVLLRLKWKHDADGSSSPKAVIEASGAFIRGLVKITRVDSSTKAKAIVVFPVEAGTTSYWRESAWSERRGFPRAVTAHELRIIYAGSDSDKQTLWASAVDDFENFQPGVEDSDSWNYSLASDQQNEVRWMVSQKSLLVGTSGDEWVVSATKEEAIITPTNVRARRHSGNGSASIPALLLDDSVLFVQRGGTRLREMSYSFEADGYRSEDLTMLAEHVAASGIVSMSHQSQVDSILWCVTGDGWLAALTYEKAQAVVGWHRHRTGDGNDAFLSVAVSRNEGMPDQVWVQVRRRISGQDVFTVERLKDGGFFLQNPWGMLYPSASGLASWSLLLDDSDQAPWSYLYRSYALAATVRHTGLYNRTFYSTDSHVASPSDFSGGVDYNGVANTAYTVFPHWKEYLKWNGGPLYNFTVGGWWENGGTIYEVIVAHTHPDLGAGDTEPGVGTDSATYWAVVGTTPVPPPDYVLSDGYAFDDIVADGGLNYQCILSHVPDSSKEPGVGGSWETYWALMRSQYHTGDRVVSGGVVYEALSDHFPETTSEPGVGDSWASYWKIPQGQYFVGDLVSQGGENYSCTADHYPTASRKPGVGATWGGYWELRTTDNLLFFVDGGRTRQNVTLSQFDGLNHLEGRTVQILANGAILAPRVVVGGKILLGPNDSPDGVFTDICVGLSYESIIEPMALEVGMQNGTSVSREKRIHELVIYFHESYGCKVGTTMTGDFDRLAFYDSATPNGPVIFSGSLMCKIEARHVMDASFILKQDLPMPMHVLAIVPKFNIYGDQG